MRSLHGLLSVVLGIAGAVAGAVLSVVAGVVWLLGAILCVTVLLIPLGLPVLKLGRRLFTLAGDLLHLGD